MEPRSGISRREALGTGVAATTAYAALATAGCSTVPGLTARPPAAGRTLTKDELAAFLDYFDRGVAAIERSTFVASFAAHFGHSPKSEAEQLELGIKEREFRETVTALFVSQSFRDLPLEAQLHPEVQRRMRSRIDSIEASARRTANRLESLPQAEREAVRQVFRKYPDLSMAISEAVTQEATRVGVSAARRRQFRAMMTDVALRMKSQGSTRTLDEIAAHLRRLEQPGTFHHAQAVALAQGDPEPFMGAAGADALRASSAWGPLHPGSDFLERWAADPTGTNGRLTAAARHRFSKSERRPGTSRRSSVSALRTSTNPSTRSDAERAARRARRRDPRRRAQRVVRVGLIMFGLGLLATGVGGVLVASGSFAGVLLMTPGVLSAAASLFVLLAGVAMAANAEKAAKKAGEPSKSNERSKRGKAQ